MSLAELIEQDRSVQHRVFPYGSTPLGGMDWCRPSLTEGEVRVKLQSIDSSTRAYWVTAEAYRKIRERPYTHVGMWAFCREDDPAAGLISYAHSSPEAVARNLHEEKKSNKRLQEAVDRLLTCGNHIATYRTEQWPDYPLDGLTREQQCEHALRRLGAGREYDMWCCWSGMMQARDALSAGQRDGG
jgi:hypothetical protein